MSYDVDTPADARLWPYTPDWSRPFDVRRSFSTDIITSRDGTEQRRALRAEPRISAEYRTVVSGAGRRAADHHMRAWQNKPVVVPDPIRWAYLVDAAAAGSSSLTASTSLSGVVDDLRLLAGDMQSGTDRRILAGDAFVPGEHRMVREIIAALPTWAAAGQILVLCNSSQMEEVLIDSVFGVTLTLAGALENSWSEGDFVRPSFFGLFEGRIGSSRPNGDTATYDISLDCYPGGEPPRDAGSAWASLNGIEIFTPTPDYAGAPTVGHLWPVDQVDFGRGRTAQFRPVDFMARQVEADFNGLAVSFASAIEQFFDRMKGRRTAFYLPTWEADFVLAASAGSGSSAMVVSGSDLAVDFATTDYGVVNEGLAVCLTNGTTLYRRITDVSFSGGNSQIAVDSAWGVALSTANVARIMRMPLSRFSSDEMTTSWRTPLSASTRLTFQQVLG